MSEWLVTIILGIVEGITEFLPISSTGHLLLIQKLFGFERSEFFNVGIQAGAVLAVALIYWRRLMNLLLRWKEKANRDFLFKLVAAFGVTVALGLIVRKLGFSLEDSNAWAVTWAVIIGALLIIYSEKQLSRREASENVSWLTAALCGIAQVIAGIFPGTSRSAATIIAAMLMGTSRTAATEFSFILGIPTMFAASGYLLVEDLMAEGIPPAGEIQHFALGFVVSTIVAFIAVKWLLHFIRTHTFIPFAVYRLLLGICLLIWLIWGARGI